MPEHSESNVTDDPHAYIKSLSDEELRQQYQGSVKAIKQLHVDADHPLAKAANEILNRYVVEAGTRRINLSE